jgi:hypothetical protein
MSFRIIADHAGERSIGGADTFHGRHRAAGREHCGDPIPARGKGWVAARNRIRDHGRAGQAADGTSVVNQGTRIAAVISIDADVRRATSLAGRNAEAEGFYGDRVGNLDRIGILR